MPVPNSPGDLSQNPNDNYPTGSESIGNSLDDYIRTHAAFIRQMYSLASSSISAASTVNVAPADGESVLITGTGTINSLGAGYVGCKRELRFEDVCTLTHSSDLQLPGAANITTEAGDAFTFRCVDSGVWLYVGGKTLGGGGGGSITPIPVTGNITLDATFLDQIAEKTVTGNLTVTLPPSLGTAGRIITLSNAAASGNWTISRGSGVALYRYQQNANIIIPARRMVSIYLSGTTDTWYST